MSGRIGKVWATRWLGVERGHARPSRWVWIALSYLISCRCSVSHRISSSGPVTKTDIKAWQAAFNVNFFSLVTMLQAATPALRESKGKIVFVSSGAATGDTQGWAAYNSTKASLWRSPAACSISSIVPSFIGGHEFVVQNVCKGGEGHQLFRGPTGSSRREYLYIGQDSKVITFLSTDSFSMKTEVGNLVFPSTAPLRA